MKNEFAFIKTDRKFIKLKFDNIAFIKGMGNYVEVFTVNDNKYIYYKSLKELIDNLPDEFMRIHNSYIINLAHVDSIEENHILTRGVKISVTKSYQDCMNETLLKLML
jgi:DNA-binding LytR/AlgR family response regulator